ncbi:hypothetical protein ACIBG8_17955 [Nonomuraea sp. NPDC050556]|uniref:hypothetical protein n=1 Tax=Nonomuraea sp. NPDC050556 TaxID=3364369 RepID=UPI0037A7B89B
MWIKLAAAAVIGGVAGLAVFELASLGGRAVFVATGVLAGLAAAGGLGFYQRSARLTEVRVSVPQLSELTFVVNDESRQVAWRLFVETVTRVSTQPLDDDDGLVREALGSLHGLFVTTRDTLKSTRPSAPVPGGQTVEHLAITMLNKVLRPFLSTWHPRLSEFERANPRTAESAWPDALACRAELRAVQADLYGYAMGFARLAGVREPETIVSARL